jgi:transcriptional regulator with XRE-family HTH domain
LCYHEIVDGRALKAWRREHGFTQAGLARALGVHPMAVSHWERGARRIPAMLSLALEALEQKEKPDRRKEVKQGAVD